MVLAVGSRQHVFHIIQTADKTGSEIEANRAVWCSRAGTFLEGGEAGAEGLIHHGPKRATAAPHERLQPCGHIIIQGQRRSHILMLYD